MFHPSWPHRICNVINYIDPSHPERPPPLADCGPEPMPPCQEPRLFLDQASPAWGDSVLCQAGRRPQCQWRWAAPTDTRCQPDRGNSAETGVSVPASWPQINTVWCALIVAQPDPHWTGRRPRRNCWSGGPEQVFRSSGHTEAAGYYWFITDSSVGKSVWFESGFCFCVTVVALQCAVTPLGGGLWVFVLLQLQIFVPRDVKRHKMTGNKLES